MKTTSRWPALLGVIGAFATLGAWQIPLPQTDYVIDLLAAHKSTEPAPGDVAPGDRLGVRLDPRGSPTDAPRAQNPLSVTLLGTDRTTYAIGDPITYAVTIRNGGATPFAFPTSAEGNRFARSMPGARLAALSLIFKDSVLGTQLVGTELLYGAQSVAGSLLTLEPGQTVRIRASGEWWLRAAFRASLPDRWTRDLQLKATLQLHHLDQDVPSADSANVVKVRLEK